MRGYLPAWSVRLLPGVIRVPLRAVPLPTLRLSQVSPERLEVLERMAHEERRARRAGPYEPARRLY